MKRMAACLLALCACRLLTLSCFALTYVDDFNDSSNNNIKSYTNLIHYNLDGSRFASLPDRTAFTFASTGNPLGAAVYRVQNAQSLTVGFYTMSGSFYAQSPDTGQWYLGLFDAADNLQGRVLSQASYSPSTGGVYAVINGKPHMAYSQSHSAGHIFHETPSLPGDLTGYGVNAYASSNGQAWTRISLMQSRLSHSPRDPFVYEELQGAVPSWAQYIKVELNDFTQIPVFESPGQSVRKTEFFSCIASVSLTGSNLILGIPEPEVAEPLPPGEEAWESSSAASKVSSSKAATTKSTTKSTAGSTAASSRYSAAKFEGVIESSVASKKSAAASSKSSSSQPSEKASSVAQSAEDASAEDMYRYAQVDAIYQIPTKNNDDITFTVAVTAYIIIMTALIAFVVIKSSGKRGSGRES